MQQTVWYRRFQSRGCLYSPCLSKVYFCRTRSLARFVEFCSKTKKKPFFSKREEISDGTWMVGWERLVVCYWACPVKAPRSGGGASPAALAPLQKEELWAWSRSLPPGRLQTLVDAALRMWPACALQGRCPSSIHPTKKSSAEKEMDKKTLSFVHLPCKGFGSLEAWKTSK